MPNRRRRDINGARLRLSLRSAVSRLRRQARKSNRKVFDVLVERQKECARFRFHDGAIGWVTRKSLDRIHRLPEGQDRDLDSVTNRSPEHESSAMTRNATKLWQERVPEEGDISNGAIRGGEGRPRANDPKFVIELHASRPCCQ